VAGLKDKFQDVWEAAAVRVDGKTTTKGLWVRVNKLRHCLPENMEEVQKQEPLRM
jgi:hypothetical protein